MLESWSNVPSQVVTTGCSGSGAPIHALCKIVGESNVRELAASENHVSCEGRKYFRQGLIPTPTSQATTLALPGHSDDESEEGSELFPIND